MTSAEVRKSYLDFFRSKEHTIVRSASLMPDSPNLLFTNAGMNQFVPIFLGQRAADVSKWGEAVPAKDTRAADTQKCIRAGGKHNDLEDVGLDTYHHTFFEMLGNWSFGDYFKREAIDWAWELITEVWKFPKNRLYATVYCPDKTKGDPSEFDQEAWDYWAEKFRAAGLDPAVQIVNGGKKDNFWMMGDTGPCGPCSEIHVDLTPAGDTRGGLVNKGSAQCIEIWNLVFIQFNANPDGTFSPLPARHVDTGMGFERVAGIIQNTRNFTDFSRMVSNYETDIFRPIFDRLEALSGARYASTLPKEGNGATEQERIDIAFRVIGDHIRTLSFAIADGIQPGNTDRNYVLRRILRRAVRYGRTLGFREPFFYKLVHVLADTMGDVFPELRTRKDHVEDVIQREEVAFNKTLDRGIDLFLQEVGTLKGSMLSGEFAFKLYDTYGFPLDLTELMARERGLAVEVEGFNRLMEEQKARARAAQKKEIIEVSSLDISTPTKFVGYEELDTPSRVLQVLGIKDKTAVLLDSSPFYAEMGGQVGDVGEISGGGHLWRVVNTQKAGDAWLHFLEDSEAPPVGAEVTLSVDRTRRNAVQRHHTVTHLLHWALHEVVNQDASQKGSYVGPDKLTFDFTSSPLTPVQLSDIERIVNERILENALVSWIEVKYGHIKDRKDVMQFFGDKYGDWVRVVQIGGGATNLDGYSMELCGGTHTRATGEIGLFRITGESAIAAGIRRIEAVSGLAAYRQTIQQSELIKSVASRVNSPVGELEKKVESMLAHQKELERQLRGMQQKQAAGIARGLLAKVRSIGDVPVIIENLGEGDGDYLQGIADSLKGEFKGVLVLGSASGGAVALISTVSSELTKRIQAGKIIQAIAPVVGGKGGGRPDNARGGGKEVGKLGEALEKACECVQQAK
ncbi:MAG: alanine--tRNA ligase [Verrucomicrobia bacterium]|nr:alanine--tRNA ligase [Verrucomicrobiota bacterium]